MSPTHANDADRIRALEARVDGLEDLLVDATNVLVDNGLPIFTRSELLPLLAEVVGADVVAQGGKR